MRLFNPWWKTTLLSLTLSLVSCGTPKPNIDVDDYVVGSYEGPAGGSVACTEVHTLFTTTSPAHFGLTACLERLIGKVYMDGDALNTIIMNEDLMCTSLGSCTYEQQQMVNNIKAAFAQIKKILPRKRK